MMLKLKGTFSTSHRDLMPSLGAILFELPNEPSQMSLATTPACDRRMDGRTGLWHGYRAT